MALSGSVTPMVLATVLTMSSVLSVEVAGTGLIPSFKCCLMSSDVGWLIRDKLRPMREHGSLLLYVHGNHEAR